MNRIHIVGGKNHGKTTVIVDLIEEFTRRGLRVGAIKHTSHVHELDVPGKDSHRQRSAGAEPVAVVAASGIGVFMARPQDDAVYDRLAPLFTGCDLVLVEGNLDAQIVKVEVWRSSVGGICLASARNDIAAVITDDRLDIDRPVWPRSNLALLAERILSLVDADHSSLCEAQRTK